MTQELRALVALPEEVQSKGLHGSSQASVTPGPGCPTPFKHCRHALTNSCKHTYIHRKRNDLNRGTDSEDGVVGRN